MRRYLRLAHPAKQTQRVITSAVHAALLAWDCAIKSYMFIRKIYVISAFKSR